MKFSGESTGLLIMYDEQQKILRRNYVTLVDELDPNEVFDYLQQDGIFTESDHELINTGKTRKERCRKLLGILPTRGPDAYYSFKNALKQSCSHLEELLHGTESTVARYECVDGCESIRNSPPSKERKHKVCLNCQPFIPVYIVDPSLRTAIQENCCLILQNVEVNDLLDLLYQESILEGHDYESIKSEKTRRDRCIALLKKLSTCGHDNVFNIFRESLRQKYGYIAQRLREIKVEIPVVPKHSEEEIGEECSHPILLEVMRRGLGVSKVKTPTSVSTLLIPNLDMSFLTNSEAKGVYNTDNLDFRVTTNVELSSYDRYFHTTKYPGNYSSRSLKNTQCHQTTIYSDTSEEDIARNIVHKKQEERIKRQRKKLSSKSKFTESMSLVPTHFNVLPQSRNLHKRGHEIVFNSLSTLINQGRYDQFEKCAVEIRLKQGSDKDISCTLDYLFASRFLHSVDVDSAKRYIKTGFKLARQTNNPKYFTLELLTSQTRMLSIKKKFEKLQRTLDDAKMMIEADPTSCTGRAAGWLYMNDVKHIMVQISMLNTQRSTYPSVYEHLYKIAKKSCEKSLDNFKREEGNDGPFGFGFALCRLIILLLRCGDRGLYREDVLPSVEDIELAGKYLRQLEDSDIPITAFLKVPLLLAKSDYHYRRKHVLRALEYAEEAFLLAVNNSILEFKEQAQNRITFLHSKMDAELLTDSIDLSAEMDCSSG
ncbi:uncharacterized protein LOC132560955 isoform X2 [Ylistrum balloti]|uniref:uncharacterized protein LOC132560955 isoform X2 n=1 Tax=Ylistrum balloti TaxID=509963 RepID=UPI002905B0DB|nr:uncharacterized protein LOC132560955 isoform X2 [Ylistrum balloti]